MVRKSSCYVNYTKVLNCGKDYSHTILYSKIKGLIYKGGKMEIGTLKPVIVGMDNGRVSKVLWVCDHCNWKTWIRFLNRSCPKCRIASKMIEVHN